MVLKEACNLFRSDLQRPNLGALFGWDRFSGRCFATVGGFVFRLCVRFQFHDCTADCYREVAQGWTVLVRVAV